MKRTLTPIAALFLLACLASTPLHADGYVGFSYGESNADMQDALRDLLKRRGYRVLVIGDVQRALARFEDANPPSDCVIFCTTELGEAALEGFNKLGQMENTKNVPAVLFVAEAHHHLAKRAQRSEHRVLLAMPLKVRKLRAILLKLLSRETAG